MRFTEIANPEDQLALWKLISDKMWAAFALPVPQIANRQVPQSSTPQGRVAIPAKPVARAMPKTPHKSAVKAKVKAVKPKHVPMAPTPKQLPKSKPQPQQLTPSQATKQQTQQHQQIAQHLQKEISKANPQHRIYPQPPTPTQKLPTPTVPMTNGYDERDKDELAFHSRAQHPFRTISQTKSTLSGQKRGF